MVVLSIDPSLASSAYGVDDCAGSWLRALASGLIATRPRVPLDRRLADIDARVGELLDQHVPEAIAIWELYLGANARTASAIGQARGALLLVAGPSQIPSLSYALRHVNGAVCGSGRADRGQVARMVAQLLALPAPPHPDPAGDALAFAICDLNRAPLARAVARA